MALELSHEKVGANDTCISTAVLNTAVILVQELTCA